MNFTPEAASATRQPSEKLSLSESAMFSPSREANPIVTLDHSPTCACSDCSRLDALILRDW